MINIKNYTVKLTSPTTSVNLHYGTFNECHNEFEEIIKKYCEGGAKIARHALSCAVYTRGLLVLLEVSPNEE